MKLFSFFVVFWICNGSRYKFFKTEKGEMLMQYKNGVISKILDDETFKILQEHDKRETYETISDNDLEKMTFGSPISHLYANDRTPDERMRTYIQYIEAVEPTNFFITKTTYFPWISNPSLARWHNATLFSWRKSFENSKIVFGWLNDDMTKVDEDKSYLGLNYSNTNFLIKDVGFNTVQEDPRLLVLSDNRLLISYSGCFNFFLQPFLICR
jgi:hypothetical protein